jgi:peroxiredoxin
MLRNTVLVLALTIGATALAEVKAGDRAADFEKKSTTGETVKLSNLRGKVVLVDFWASWCEPCKKELPILGKMASRLKAKGIEIVTINIDDKKANAEDFLRSKGIAGLTVVPDLDKSIVGQYEPPKMPSSFVIDKSGVVRTVNAGFDDGDERKIEQQLSSLAAKDK